MPLEEFEPLLRSFFATPKQSIYLAGRGQRVRRLGRRPGGECDGGLIEPPAQRLAARGALRGIGSLRGEQCPAPSGEHDLEQESEPQPAVVDRSTTQRAPVGDDVGAAGVHSRLAALQVPRQLDLGWRPAGQPPVDGDDTVIDEPGDGRA